VCLPWDVSIHCVELSGFCSMFLSRTVAAEVCMEAKSNEFAYAALKKLDESGDLLFELRCVSMTPSMVITETFIIP
jgi:hypothetical protein